MNLSDLFDLYAREFFNPQLGEENAETIFPKVEVHQTVSGYSVRAELPGINPDAVDLSLDDNCLIIKGESFFRMIPFRFDVDDSKSEAKFRDGVLFVSLVKKDDGTLKSKKIPITH